MSACYGEPSRNVVATREEPQTIDSSVRAASKTTKPCQVFPGRVLKMLGLKTLVVGRGAVIRTCRGNPRDSRRHYGDRTRCGTRSSARAAARACGCTTRLRHRVAGECGKEKHRY